MNDEELAQKLADDMSVKELRKWMKQRDISRKRGASKMQSARRAVTKNRQAVEDYFGLNEPFHVGCMCGFEAKLDNEEEAIRTAKEHSIETADCNAKAWHPKGHQIYGRLGTRSNEF